MVRTGAEIRTDAAETAGLIHRIIRTIRICAVAPPTSHTLYVVRDAGLSPAPGAV
jgi:hypothetical protein